MSSPQGEGPDSSATEASSSGGVLEPHPSNPDIIGDVSTVQQQTPELGETDRSMEDTERQPDDAGRENVSATGPPAESTTNEQIPSIATSSPENYTPSSEVLAVRPLHSNTDEDGGPSIDSTPALSSSGSETDLYATRSPVSPPAVPSRTPSSTENLRALLQETYISPPGRQGSSSAGGLGRSYEARTSTEYSVPADWPLSSQRGDLRYMRQRMGSFQTTQPRNRPDQTSSQAPDQDAAEPADFVLARWQPDAEVTYCPICNSQFSIFVRKHHCRKCGRVVCNSCSPHRIMIPHQYIVRQPGSDTPLPQSLLVDGFGAGYMNANGTSGGERVRLCNPCVPDPNTAPPQSPSQASSPLSPRTPHQRTRSNAGGAHGPGSQSTWYGGLFEGGSRNDPLLLYAPRSRSITVQDARAAGSPAPRRPSSYTHQSPFDQLLSAAPSNSVAIHRRSLHGASDEHGSTSRPRTRRPVRQIPEEDECPVCHRELPSTSLPNAEALRESHITSCIEDHSAYASPRRGTPREGHVPAQRRTGMYIYPASEKDCIDDAECTICLEEFAVGVQMARLECLCRFHRSCIAAWFVNHPGRCPVHQHDGFGY